MKSLAVYSATRTCIQLKTHMRDFPGGAVVKNPLCNAGAGWPPLARELRSHMQYSS